MSACTYDQTFPGVLIDYCKHSHSLSITRPGQYEIIGPDVVAMSRPQPDARTIVEPQSSSLGLFLWDLQPFPSPDPLHLLVVDLPALTP